jgi:glycosyltransferase involved in cell wall biosynthesis
MLLTGIYKIKARPTLTNKLAITDDDGFTPIVLCPESYLKDILRHPPPFKFKYLVVFTLWSATTKNLLKNRLYQTLLSRKKYKVMWATVDAISSKKMQILGLNSYPLQANMFCREDIFKPDTSLKKIYDAIYICALEKYKRPWLSKGIDKLRIATRSYKKDTKKITKKFEISHATINTTWISRDELAKEINKSKCGLALSKKEGSMYAATEYLLCGIPIVSTPSTGGRDLWYTKKNHILCGDNAISVKNSVKLCEEKIKDGSLSSPQKIASDARKIQNWERTKLITRCKEKFNVWLDKENLKPNNIQFYQLDKKNHLWQEIDIIENPNP